MYDFQKGGNKKKWNVWSRTKLFCVTYTVKIVCSRERKEDVVGFLFKEINIHCVLYVGMFFKW